MASKKLLIREIVDYINTQYKSDPRIVELVTKFNNIEDKLAKNRQNRKASKYVNILPNKFVLTKEARDWLVPLADAEYFKYINYHPEDERIDAMIYAMQCLRTPVFENLLKQTILDKTIMGEE